MVYHVGMMLLLITVFSSCATAQRTESKPKVQNHSLMDVYLSGAATGHKEAQHYLDTHLTQRDTYGYVKPYIPVVEQAIVRKVWIPDAPSETDAQVLVAGHWAYVMVKQATWFVHDSSPQGTDNKFPRVPLNLQVQEGHNYGS